MDEGELDGMDFADEGTARMRGERRPTLDERADIAKRQAEEVDQVADDVARVEADADAAALEADAMRQAEKEAVTAEAGRVERAKAAVAEEKLSLQEWMDKKYPKGRGGKRHQTILDEYNKYKKEDITGAPPGTAAEKIAARKSKPYGKNLTLRARVFDRVIDNVNKVNPDAAAKLTAYQDTWDGYVSKKTTVKKKILETYGVKAKSGSDQAKAIVHALDGTPELGPPGYVLSEAEPELGPPGYVLSEAEENVVKHLRKVEDRVIREAQNAGVKVDYRENHFPHFGRKRVRGEAGVGGGGDEALVTGPEAHHFEPRKVDDPDWIDDDLGVLDLYYDEAGRKIAQRKHLGAGNDLLRKDLKKYLYDEKTRSYLTRNINRVLGRGEEGLLGVSARAHAKIRKWFAFAKLPKAGIRQVSQMGDIAAVTNLEDTIKTLAKYRFDPEFKKGLRFRAEYSGALRPDMVFDQMGAIHSREMLNPPKFMWGVRRMDGLNRVVAYGVGEQLAKAAKTNPGILDELVSMGLKRTEGRIPSGREVGKFVSDLTQFQGGPLYRPGWTNSELGRYIFQFHNFPYNHSRLVHKMLTTDPGTAAKMVAKMVVGTGGIAAGVNQILSWAKGYNPGRYGTPEFEDLPIEDKLQTLFAIERINTESPGWRLAQELMDNALWGEYTNLFRRGGELGLELAGEAGGRPASITEELGAAPSTIGRVAGAAGISARRLAKEAITGEEVEDPFGPVSREALRQIPDVPGFGAVAAELSGGRGHSIQEALWPSKWQMDRYKRRYFDPRLGGRFESKWGIPLWTEEDARAGGRPGYGGGRR
jgi:hypothetical protein